MFTKDDRANCGPNPTVFRHLSNSKDHVSDDARTGPAIVTGEFIDGRPHCLNEAGIVPSPDGGPGAVYVTGDTSDGDELVVPVGTAAAGFSN